MVDTQVPPRFRLKRIACVAEVAAPKGLHVFRATGLVQTVEDVEW